MPVKNPEAVESDDEVLEASSSDRRIWKRRLARTEGTSDLVLRVYDVLYDAGEPLTREQIAERLHPRLSATAIGYLKAWHARLLTQHAEHRRQRGINVLVGNSTRTFDISVILQIWLGKVFDQRRTKTRSLLRDAEGRYSPGPVAPWMVTLDNQRLQYTPEVRTLLELQQQHAGRGHLAKVAWSKLIADPAYTDIHARAQLVMFLVKQLVNKGQPEPLKERQLRARCAYLLKVADTPAIQRTILESAIKDLLTLL